MAAAAPGQLNLDESPSWGSRSVDCFEKLEQIGEGTYGYVRSRSKDSIFLVFSPFPTFSQSNMSVWFCEKGSFLVCIALGLWKSQFFFSTYRTEEFVWVLMNVVVLVGLTQLACIYIYIYVGLIVFKLIAMALCYCRNMFVGSFESPSLCQISIIVSHGLSRRGSQSKLIKRSLMIDCFSRR